MDEKHASRPKVRKLWELTLRGVLGLDSKDFVVVCKRVIGSGKLGLIVLEVNFVGEALWNGGKRHQCTLPVRLEKKQGK